MNPRPLTVVRVLNWLPVGGVEHRLIQLLPRLNPARFRPHIVLLRERGELADRAESLGIPVHLSPLASRLSPPGLWRLSRLFRTLGADIVHSHMYRSNTPATIAARLAGVPTILSQVHTIHSWNTRRQRMMDRFLMRWRAAMIAVSEGVKDDIVGELRIDPGRIRVLYNGVNLEDFRVVLESREQERKREGLPMFGVVAIHVARLIDAKNHSTLLRAFARIFERVKELTLFLVGDGPLRASLEAEADSLGVARRVVFAGRRHDVARLLALADFSVLPSVREGFSNVVVESMAAGLPMLVSDVSGNTEAVRDGQEGLVLHDPTDVAKLADLLERLATDCSLRAELGKNAARRAEVFSLDAMARKTEELYLEMHGRRSAPR